MSEKRIVIGDVVNTAARLCGAAASGQVLVSGETRRAAGDIEAVSFRALPPMAVKGKREPVNVFEAFRTGPERGSAAPAALR